MALKSFAETSHSSRVEMLKQAVLVLDAFGARQFDRLNKGASSIIDYDPLEFTRRVNEVLMPSCLINAPAVPPSFRKMK